MPSHHTVEKDLLTVGVEKRTPAGVACFHSSRHTFTTLVSRATGDLRLAKEMAGHEDIVTTQGDLHTELDEHASAMERFERLRAIGRATEVVHTGLSVSQSDESGPSASGLQVSQEEALRPDWSERVVRCLKVEPGGIEPPCRNSRLLASTRVSAV